jgi:hypothetical protein
VDVEHCTGCDVGGKLAAHRLAERFGAHAALGYARGAENAGLALRPKGDRATRAGRLGVVEHTCIHCPLAFKCDKRCAAHALRNAHRQPGDMRLAGDAPRGRRRES